MQRRELSFTDFDAVLADIDRLHSRGCDRAGNWDLAQVCDHLDLSIRMTLDPHPPAGPWLVRTFLAPLILKKLLKTRKIRAGIEIPEEFRPKQGKDAEAAIRSLRTTIKRFEDHAGEYEPHPFFGKLSRERARQLHLVHAAHHLSFLSPR